MTEQERKSVKFFRDLAKAEAKGYTFEKAYQIALAKNPKR